MKLRNPWKQFRMDHYRIELLEKEAMHQARIIEDLRAVLSEVYAHQRREDEAKKLAG